MDIGSLTGKIEIEDAASSVLEKFGEQIKEFAERFEGMTKKILEGSALVVAGIAAVTGAVIALGEKGSTITGVTDAFDRLALQAGTTGDALREGLRSGVKGTVDDLKLMETTSRLLTTGMKLTEDQTRLMGQAAREMGKATGTDAADGLQILSTALTTGRTRSLAMAGIVVDLKKAEEDFAKSLGTTADQLNKEGKLEADRIGILKATQAYVDRLGESQLTFKERIQQAQVAVEEWGVKLAVSVASSPNVMAALDAIGNAITKNFGGAGETALEVITGWINKFADAVASYGPVIIKWLADVWQGVVDIWHTVQQAWDLVPDWFKNIAKEAGVAAGAVYLTNEAMKGFTGTDTLGMMANLAQVWSVLRVEGLALVPVIRDIGGALQNLSVIEAITVSFNAFMSTGIGRLSFWTGVAVGLYEIANALGAIWDRWRAGESAWRVLFLPAPGSMIGNWFGMSDGIDKTSASLKALGEQKAGLEALMRIRSAPDVQQGPNLPTGAPNYIKPPDASKIEAATQASIAKTSELWDQYFSLVESRNGKTFESMAAEVERWYTAQRATLDKSIKTNKDYYNQLDALNAVADEKRRAVNPDTFAEAATRATALLEAQIHEHLLPTIVSLDKNINAMFSGYNDKVPLVSHALQGVSQITGLVGTEFTNVQKVIADTMDKNTKAFFPLSEVEKAQVQQLHELGFAAEEIAPMFGRSLSVITPIVQHFGEDLKKAFSNTIKGFPDLLVQAFTGGGGLSGALSAIGAQLGNDLGAGIVKNFGKSITNVLGDTLGGAINTFLPGIGSLIGTGISALLSIGKPSKEELDARSKQLDLVKQLAAGATAAEKAEIALNQATFKTGPIYSTLAVVGRDAMLAIGKSAAEAGEVVKGLLNTHDPAVFAAAMQQVQDALTLQKTATNALNDALSRYKFTTEQLGPALRAQKLDEQSQQLYKDWQVLTQAGIDVSAVTQQMSTDIEDYITTAIKTGTEVPEAMKPMLQSMIDQGLLTDLAGNKITDLASSGISFATTMTQGFKDIVTSVKELTDVLRRGLGLAIDETVTKIGTIPRSINVDVNLNGPSLPEAPIQLDNSYGSTGGTVYAAMGRVLPFQPRGTDVVPAMLTPGETVRTTSQEAQVQHDLQRGTGTVIDMRGSMVLDGPSLQRFIDTHVWKKMGDAVNVRDVGGATNVIKKAAS
jgi:hypothetical protein